MNLIVPITYDYVNIDTGFIQNGFSNPGMDKLADPAAGFCEPPSFRTSDRTALKESCLTENRSIDFHTTVRSALPTSNNLARLNNVVAPPMQRTARPAETVNVFKCEKDSTGVQHTMDWQLLNEIRPTMICASDQQ